MDGVGRTVLIASPSADVYGSDLQMAQSVVGLSQHGWRVHVMLPATGELTSILEASGADVSLVDFPVLRRADASPAGMARLVRAGLNAVRTIRQAVRRVGPDVVLVNTVTLPWWLVAARSTGTPTMCHVHEAEARDPRLVRAALAVPLLAAHTIVVNSRTTFESVCQVVPLLRGRTRLVYNGVQPPSGEPSARTPDEQTRLVVIGRLSPRKGPDIALEAVARLRADGLNVSLELCGTPVASQEWFRDRLVRRSHQPDLEGSVTFADYTSPIWPALARADIVLAPSLGESFGNVVVEGQLARRPVVATAVQGHLETVDDGRTGLLVPPEDPAATAAAIKRLMADPTLARRVADEGRRVALERFTAQRFREEMASVVAQVAGS